jgi:hypothetical protein
MEGRSSLAQTNAKVNCTLLSQYQYLAPSRHVSFKCIILSYSLYVDFNLSAKGASTIISTHQSGKNVPIHLKHEDWKIHLEQ